MITVKAEKYRDAREDAIYEGVSRRYRDLTGLAMVENCSRSGISDFCEGHIRRYSEDNGKTWTEWEAVPTEDTSYDNMGEHDRNFPFHPTEHWNPVHKHWVGPGMERIFKGGHEKALSQIKDRDYVHGLKGDVLLYGIAFRGKEPKIVSEIVHQ